MISHGREVQNYEKDDNVIYVQNEIQMTNCFKLNSSIWYVERFAVHVNTDYAILSDFFFFF